MATFLATIFLFLFFSPFLSFLSSLKNRLFSFPPLSEPVAESTSSRHSLPKRARQDEKKKSDVSQNVGKSIAFGFLFFFIFKAPLSRHIFLSKFDAIPFRYFNIFPETRVLLPEVLLPRAAAMEIEDGELMYLELQARGVCLRVYTKMCTRKHGKRVRYWYADRWLRLLLMFATP